MLFIFSNVQRTLCFPGMCKHLHTAFTLAAARGTDVHQQRFSRAKELYEEEAYTVDGNYMFVIDTSVGNVDMKTMTCICTAASHGIFCICKKVAGLYKEENSIEYNIPMETDSQEPSIVDGPCDTAGQNLGKFKGMLNDIQQWAESADDVPLSILNETRKLHTLLFGQYNTALRHRKITPLHPYRKAVNKAKKALVDHKYTSLAGKKPRKCSRTVCQDGAFSVKKTSKRVSFSK